MKVSVIVPVYNTEKYIVKTLDTICNQTLQEIEIILVNDGSTDRSLEIVTSYAEKDSRISVINNDKKGSGAGGARNTGLRVAKGKYLSFLDSDDIFDLQMLEVMYARSERLQTDITMCDAYIVEYDTQLPIGTVIPINGKNKFMEQEVFNIHTMGDIVFYASANVVWTSLYRREFIQKEQIQFQEIRYNNDLLFGKLAIASAKAISCCEEHFVYYNMRRPQSLQTESKKEISFFIEAVAELKKILIERNLFEYCKNGYVNSLVYLFDWKLSLQAEIALHQFQKTFELIAKQYMPEFEIEESLTESFVPFDAKEWLQRLKNNDQPWYLFDILQKKKRARIYYESDVVFPHTRVGKEERVILYGAGNIGTSFYLQNIQHKYCKLVAWVDKNPKGKQIPIQGLDALQFVPCDKVIIAIDNQAVFQEVKQYLLHMGFQLNQIIGIVPETTL